MMSDRDRLFGLPILVVDDEPTNTKLLERLLSKVGYRQIIVTNDSRQTLSLCEQHRPGLILLDLNMPELDGFAVLAQLHAAYPQDPPPVVMLTAQSDQTSRLNALRGGARDFVTKPFDRTELLVRIENMLRLKLAEDERVRLGALLDPITGLPNRKRTEELLQERIDTRADRTQRLALALLEVQQFKRINQSFGYEGGDRVLCLLKERLLRTLSGHRSILGRAEGARFLIVLPDVPAQDAALADFFQAIMDRVQQPLELDGVEIRLSSHLGVALFPQDGDSAARLLAGAEVALAGASHNSDQGYAFFDHGTNQRVREQLELESELHRALEREEFFLVYQPQVVLPTGRIRGVEALLRWRHPLRGVISPAAFIPLLEETGLIVPVGKWLLHKAFAQAQAWQAAGIPPLRMAVNLSPRQFQDKQLIEHIQQALAETGLSPEQVELEVTESLLVKDFPGTRQLLEAIGELGIQLALDDFGTGYSALTYLHAFPFQALKIDRSFIAAISTSGKSKNLLAGVIQLGKSLGLEAIAEGIEKAIQRDRLLELGCTLGQGFGFARPLPPAEIEPLLRTGILTVHD